MSYDRKDAAKDIVKFLKTRDRSYLDEVAYLVRHSGPLCWIGVHRSEQAMRVRWDGYEWESYCRTCDKEIDPFRWRLFEALERNRVSRPALNAYWGLRTWWWDLRHGDEDEVS